jgi:DNA-binding HxlR family transcriptional regulator
MLGRTYDLEVCSAARALELVGERWSLLIIRNAAFAGMTRFSEFQKALNLAPNILAARLQHFVESGLMRTSGEPGSHQSYHLTEMGLDFKPALIALTEWGDRWAAPEGPPIVYEHEGCAGHVKSEIRCEGCGEQVPPEAVAARKTEVMARLREERAARARKKGSAAR